MSRHTPVSEGHHADGADPGSSAPREEPSDAAADAAAADAAAAAPNSGDCSADEGDGAGPEVVPKDTQDEELDMQSRLHTQELEYLDNSL